MKYNPIDLVEKYNKLPLIIEVEATGQYVKPDWIRDWLREQQKAIDVAMETCYAIGYEDAAEEWRKKEAGE